MLLIPMRIIPASGGGGEGGGKLSWSYLLTIYEFESIQFSDSLMSDGYLHIF